MDSDIAVDAEAQTRARFEDELRQAYERGYSDALRKHPDGTGISFDTALDQVIATTQPVFMPESDVVIVKGVTYTRADVTHRPNFPTRIRVEANRPLDDTEVTALHHLMAYNYKSTVRGDGLGRPRRDTDRSFVSAFDSVFSERTDPNASCDDFESNLDAWLLEGSPVRATNRAGAGTKGTRAVAGLDDPDLRVAIYYDRVI